MKYELKSFTVPASSAKSPADCNHGWKDWKRYRCVLCGVSLSECKPDFPLLHGGMPDDSGNYIAFITSETRPSNAVGVPCE